VSLYELLPRYKEAVDYENQLRTLSFLPVHDYIGNIPVVQFSPVKYILLESAHNPFVCGGTIEPSDIVQFIWALSPDYGQLNKREAVIKLCSDLPYNETIEKIRKYLDESFIDSMEGNPIGIETITYYSWIAGLIDIFAAEYGWTSDHVLNMPFKQLYQYVKVIKERKAGDKVILWNPYSDKVKDEEMNKLNHQPAAVVEEQIKD
jgi:hypothetical protein